MGGNLPQLLNRASTHPFVKNRKSNDHNDRAAPLDYEVSGCTQGTTFDLRHIRYFYTSMFYSAVHVAAKILFTAAVVISVWWRHVDFPSLLDQSRSNRSRIFAGCGAILHWAEQTQ